MWTAFVVRWGRQYYGISPVSGGDAIVASLNNLYSYSIQTKKDLAKNFFLSGNLRAKDKEEMTAQIDLKVKEILAAGRRPLALGGEHSITYAMLKALKPSVAVVFDAHLDLCNFDPDLEENGRKERFSKATFMRRALEAGFVKKLIYIGVRDCSLEELKFSRIAGAKIFSPEEAKNAKKELASLKGAYVSIDIDALDSSIAPAVGTPVPCGLDVKTLLELLSCIKKPVGADLVEVCSEPKANDVTAMTAAYILREWISQGR